MAINDMANPDINKITRENFETELQFSSSRSSGPGGQHVNKVSTKIELRFNIKDSQFLSEEAKSVLFHKLKNKINKYGELIIVSQEYRSQIKNKEAAIEKFLDLLTKAFKPVKKRKPSKPTRASKEKRLEEKKLTSVKKSQRRKPDMD